MIITRDMDGFPPVGSCWKDADGEQRKVLGFSGTKKNSINKFVRCAYRTRNGLSGTLNVTVDEWNDWVGFAEQTPNWPGTRDLTNKAVK